MALVPKFTAATIRAMANDQKEKIITAMVNRLKLVGEKFITEARSKVSSKEYREAIGSLAYSKNERRAVIGPDTPSFQDQTANLRSSIGYVILRDGNQLYESFPGSASVGAATGKQIAAEASKNFPRGVVLIVVAGMGYAAAVEAKGYDVISGSSITAEGALIKTISELKDKLS